MLNVISGDIFWSNEDIVSSNTSKSPAIPSDTKPNIKSLIYPHSSSIRKQPIPTQKEEIKKIRHVTNDKLSPKGKKNFENSKGKNFRRNGKNPQSPDEDLSERRQSSNPIPCSFSLKDLKSEDKERVTNLVKELAKINLEKQNIASSADKEKRQFNIHTNSLLKQQDELLKDKSEIQKQLSRCQVLLSKYQKYLLSKTSTSKKEYQKKKEDHLKDFEQNSIAPTCILSKTHQLSNSNFHTKNAQNETNEVINTSKFSDLSNHPYKNVSKDQVNVRSIPSPLATRNFTTNIDNVLKRPLNTSVGHTVELCEFPNKSSPTLNDKSLQNEIFTSSNPNEDKSFIQSNNVSLKSGSTNLKTEITHPAMDFEKEKITKCVSSKTNEFSSAIQHWNGDEIQREKEALLKEQKRLKEILAQQESLLNQKQKQLHKQQEKQHHRLRYFEEFGTFPSDSSKFSLNGCDNSSNTRSFEKDCLQIPENFQNNFKLNNGIKNSLVQNDLKSSEEMESIIDLVSKLKDSETTASSNTFSTSPFLDEESQTIKDIFFIN